MLAVRFTRNIQRLQPWSRLRCSSTVANVELDGGVKKVATKTETDSAVKSSTAASAGFSKELFKTLKTANTEETPEEDLNELIAKAQSLNDLLAIGNKPNTNRYHALKIVSTLAEWSTSGKVNAAEFENNAQFIRVCSLLASGAAGSKSKRFSNKPRALEAVKSKELEMILNVAGEDESAKLIQNLQLSQMVKVLSALASKRTRSLPLLRNLSYGITSSTNKLNLKECSDVFYALTQLNFHDAMLMSRVSFDVIASLAKGATVKPAPVGSIAKSVGHLRFKDTELLDALTKWTLQNQERFRPKDLVAFCETLAIVNYQTAYVDDIRAKLLPSIVREDFLAADWLDYIWSLSALDLAEASHFKSVLSPEFIQTLVSERGPALNSTIKKKLLNINAVAKTIATNYDGPLLKPEGYIYELPFGYSKSKQTLVDGLLDTLKKLFTDQSLIETNVDTQMGFVIDAVCVLDKNQTPVKDKSKHGDAFRIAFVVLDFHDLCMGSVNEPNGISSLTIRLLKQQGYKVLPIPHVEFNTSEKIIKRVQYLDAKLKNAVSGNV